MMTDEFPIIHPPSATTGAAVATHHASIDLPMRVVVARLFCVDAFFCFPPISNPRAVPHVWKMTGTSPSRTPAWTSPRVWMLLLLLSWLWASTPFVAGICTAVAVRWLAKRLLGGAADAPRPPERPRRSTSSMITVVGNIGAGKSTALAGFKRRRPDSHVVHEPVEAWAPLLNAAVERKSAWKELQLSAAAFYAGLLNRAKPACVTVAERDAASVAVFSAHDPDVAMTLVAMAGEGLFQLPNVAVFIATSPSECLERIQRRRQAGDALVVSLGSAYLANLHERHKILAEWYEENGVLIITTADPSLAEMALEDLHEHPWDSEHDDGPRLVSRDAMKRLTERISAFGCHGPARSTE